MSRSYRIGSVMAVFIAILGSAPTASADENSVPISGQLNATITSATPVPGGVHVTAAGAGIAAHLGQFTSLENAIVYPNGTDLAMVILTAANGDQLFWTDMGTRTSPTTIVGTITFTGGTGRFQNASGTATFQALTGGGRVSITFAGTIRY
jgi:hypothetical protein